MTCQTCLSNRVVQVSGKTGDMCTISLIGTVRSDYVPYDMGGGDYLTFKYCLDCGQMQGKFPCGETDIEYGGPLS